MSRGCAGLVAAPSAVIKGFAWLFQQPGEAHDHACSTMGLATRT
jgi:hypothetical protein